MATRESVPDISNLQQKVYVSSVEKGAVASREGVVAPETLNEIGRSSGDDTDAAPNEKVTRNGEHKWRETANETTLSTLWMGGIQPHWVEAEIYNLFLHTNEVESIDIVRRSHGSRPDFGFAFIVFRSPEAAKRVLEEKNGTLIPNTNVPFDLRWRKGPKRQHDNKRATSSRADEKESSGFLSTTGSTATAPSSSSIGNAPNGMSSERHKSRAGASSMFGGSSQKLFSVYVGGLSPEVDGKKLLKPFKDRCAKHVEAEVKVEPATGSSKGYGFVRFKDRREYLDALENMNGTVICGRPVCVRTAKSSPDNALHRLQHMNDSNGSRAQQHYARQHPPHAPHYSNAQTMQQMQMPMHPQLYFNNANHGGTCALPSNDDDAPGTVFVGNLDPTVTKDQLKNHFAEIGRVLEVDIPPNRRIGFVKFENVADAETARQIKNQTLLGTNRIRLGHKRKKSPAPQGTPHAQPSPHLTYPPFMVPQNPLVVPHNVMFPAWAQLYCGPPQNMYYGIPPQHAQSFMPQNGAYPPHVTLVGPPVSIPYTYPHGFVPNGVPGQVQYANMTGETSKEEAINLMTANSDVAQGNQEDLECNELPPSTSQPPMENETKGLEMQKHMGSTDQVCATHE
mmetsp:Transcript_11090/g.20492  ORF Transcript_11090/g.20492 Transcript_11090/m.20492 type:complete len:622 (-) Transcript_11090:353-2218(-)